MAPNSLFFVEYFIVNPKVSPEKIGYGRLGDKPSYVMVKCGAWGKNKVPKQYN